MSSKYPRLTSICSVLENGLELLAPLAITSCAGIRGLSVMGNLGISRSSFSPLPVLGSLPLLFHICLLTLLSMRVPLPGSPDQERSTHTPVKTPCPSVSSTHLTPLVSVFPHNQPSILILFLSNTICFRNETILPAGEREGIYPVLKVLTAPRFIQRKDQVLLSSASATLSVADSACHTLQFRC